MSTTKRPPDIRTSYTRIERALLAAYLGYPDPAPEKNLDDEDDEDLAAEEGR